MSNEIGIEELIAAHEGIGDIIRSFYPEEPEGDAEDVVHGISSGNQSSANSLNFTLAMSNFLDDISTLVKLNQELVATADKINDATLNEASSSLTHPEKLGNLVTWCQEVEQHLRVTIENKDLLIYHLQQPLVSNFLTMHYRYHKDLISLVEELVDVLNNVPSHIQLLEEHAQNSVLKRSDSCISSVTRTVTNLRNTLGDITALQSLVTGMLEVQDE